MSKLHRPRTKPGVGTFEFDRQLPEELSRVAEHFDVNAHDAAELLIREFRGEEHDCEYREEAKKLRREIDELEAAFGDD